MVSYHRKFLKKLANQTAVLTPATSNAAPMKVKWSSDIEDAFSTICELICASCILTIPLPEDEFSLVTDVSGVGIEESCKFTETGSGRQQHTFHVRDGEQRGVTLPQSWRPWPWWRQ